MKFLQFTPHPSIDGSFDVACAVLCMDVHNEEKYSGCAHLYTNDMLHVHNVNAGAAFFIISWASHTHTPKNCGVPFLCCTSFVNGIEACWSSAANEMTLARVQYSLDCHAGRKNLLAASNAHATELRESSTRSEQVLNVQ